MLDLPARPVHLEGASVRLRAFVPADARDLERAFADELLALWNPPPDGPDPVRRFMESRNGWDDGDHASWAVADREDRLVGSVSMHRLDRDQRDSEIGYWTAPWARGRGVSTDAVVTAVRWAFGELGLHRVYLYHAVENVGSCGVAGAAGFQLEGTLRRSYRYVDGVYRDEHLHAVLDSDPLPVPRGGSRRPARGISV